MAKQRKGAKKKAAKKRSTPKPKVKKAAARRAAPKGAAKTAPAKRPPRKPAKKATTRPKGGAGARGGRTTATTHTVNVCNDWNGNAGDTVDFVNPYAITCNITPDAASEWPFTAPSSGFPVPPGGASTALQSDLQDGTYTYNVDCCEQATQHSVTVP